MQNVGWVLVILGAVGILGVVGLAIIYKAGGFVMKISHLLAAITPPLLFTAWFAYFWAQYLISNVCPEVTLIHLGGLYAVGLLPRLAIGLSLGLSKKMQS